MIWYCILFIVIYIICAIVSLTTSIVVFRDKSCYPKLVVLSFIPVVNTLLAIVVVSSFLAAQWRQEIKDKEGV